MASQTHSRTDARAILEGFDSFTLRPSRELLDLAARRGRRETHPMRFTSAWREVGTMLFRAAEQVVNVHERS